uniref:Uncharacterized protein n=1 Tax=Chrysotila carterae TaxID=13221 RepID=A0A7S4BWA9_CHRCT
MEAATERTAKLEPAEIRHDQVDKREDHDAPRALERAPNRRLLGHVRLTKLGEVTLYGSVPEMHARREDVLFRGREGQAIEEVLRARMHMCELLAHVRIPMFEWHCSIACTALMPKKEHAFDLPGSESRECLFHLPAFLMYRFLYRL